MKTRHEVGLRTVTLTLPPLSPFPKILPKMELCNKLLKRNFILFLQLRRNYVRVQVGKVFPVKYLNIEKSKHYDNCICGKLFAKH